jgi:hypothetical protein
MNRISGLFQIDKFKLVYWVIAIATAQHTAWGAATTMQGSEALGGGAQLWWWIQGLFFAIAIDYSMVMVATKIRSGTQSSQSIGIWRLRIPINWYTITFAIVALLSSYFQLLYAWSHASALNNGGGVATIWIERLQSLIDARVIVAPLALPLIATFYTIGGLGKGGEAQSKQRNIAQPLQSSRNPVASDAIHVDMEQPQPRNLPAPQLRLPAPQQMRDSNDNLVGYVCPGCHAELSISGWSRHKKTCKSLNISIER